MNYNMAIFAPETPRNGCQGRTSPENLMAEDNRISLYYRQLLTGAL